MVYNITFLFKILRVHSLFVLRSTDNKAMHSADRMQNLKPGAM